MTTRTQDAGYLASCIVRGRVSEWSGVLVLDEEDNLKLVNVVEGFATVKRTKQKHEASLEGLRAFCPSFHRVNVTSDSALK